VKSATFCPYPWLHLMTQPTGDLSFCCVAKGSLVSPDGDPCRADRDSLEDVWNGPAMREVRRAMLEGRQVKECSHCYYQESVADEIRARVDRSVETGFRVEGPPVYLDFRLGNLCNLKCRMCQPFNSSQLYAEYAKIREAHPEFESFIKPYAWGSLGIDMPNWYDDPAFVGAVEKWLPQVVKMYFTGGEPVLIPRVYWILEKAIEFGVAAGMEVVFNTNCVQIKPRFLELLSHFKKVILCASIDGHGKVQEYIRYPSKWETIERNLRTYCQSADIDILMVTPVVQLYNVYYLTELLEFTERLIDETGRRIEFEMLILDYPQVLDIRLLPDSNRAQCARRIEDWMSISRHLMVAPKFANDIRGVLNILRGPRLDGWERWMKDFHEYTGYFDRQRGVRLDTELPELESGLR